MFAVTDDTEFARLVVEDRGDFDSTQTVCLVVTGESIGSQPDCAAVTGADPEIVLVIFSYARGRSITHPVSRCVVLESRAVWCFSRQKLAESNAGTHPKPSV